MGAVYDCALCGVCEYDHDRAPHDFRYPEPHEARLGAFRDALRLLGNDGITVEHAKWVLGQWLAMEQDQDTRRRGRW